MPSAVPPLLGAMLESEFPGIFRSVGVDFAEQNGDHSRYGLGNLRRVKSGSRSLGAHLTAHLTALLTLAHPRLTPSSTASGEPPMARRTWAHRFGLSPFLEPIAAPHFRRRTGRPTGNHGQRYSIYTLCTLIDVRLFCRNIGGHRQSMKGRSSACRTKAVL